jgi:hypothetical protein
VLLDREREIRAALDGRVVRNDHALAPLDDPDPGDGPRRRRLAFVHVPRCERVQLEEGAAGVDEPVDALACGQLPARAVTLDRTLAAAACHARRPLTQLGDKRFHQRAATVEFVGVALDLRRQNRHDDTLQSRDAFG